MRRKKSSQHCHEQTTVRRALPRDDLAHDEQYCPVQRRAAGPGQWLRLKTEPRGPLGRSGDGVAPELRASHSFAERTFGQQAPPGRLLVAERFATPP
jgi:hypothetical protein